ncbi:MAG: septal ring lytic transglycosylase RlpA family protein [Bacteroidota bacterium]
MKIYSFLFALCLTFGLSAQEYGRASFYADSFQGLKTASGELYSKSEMTASHNTLPFGTMVRITRLDTKKSVVVRINDRGPFIKGRITDLSRKAAEQLGIISSGEVQVKLDVVGQGKPVSVANKTTTTPKGATAAKPKATTTAQPSTTKRPAVYNDSSVPKKVTTKSVPKAVPTQATTSTAKGSDTDADMAISEAKFVRGNYNKYGLYKIQLLKPEKKGFGVQVGSYSSYDNVMKQVADLQAKWFEDILVNIEPAEGGGSSYKVILGQFETEAAAENYKKNLQRKHGVKGFVVGLEEM